MSMRTPSAVTVLAAAVMAAALLITITGPNASGQQAAAETKSEYMVASVEANALGAKVTELANQGWEVVSVITREAKVDGAVTPPKVVTELYDVVLRRTVTK